MLELLVVVRSVGVRIEIRNLEVPGHLVVSVGGGVVSSHTSHDVSVEITDGVVGVDHKVVGEV